MKDFGILFFRVSIGAMMLLGHGTGKLLSFSEMKDAFPDPLGVGHHTSLGLVIFAEAICSLMIMLGFGTRLAAAIAAFNMFIASYVVQSPDPWNKKELAVLYLVCYVALMLVGPGKYALGKGKLD